MSRGSALSAPQSHPFLHTFMQVDVAKMGRKENEVIQVYISHSHITCIQKSCIMSFTVLSHPY